MADRPILFSGPMVRALRDGTKTQTRRVIDFAGIEKVREFVSVATCNKTGRRVYEMKDAAGAFTTRPAGKHFCDYHFMPRFAVDDRLWVRETWTARMTHGWTIADARSRMFDEEILYAADGDTSIDGWWPSIHMPREFSRLTLAVTAVRVERLRDISEADASAEGVASDTDGWCDYLMPATQSCTSARDSFRTLWDSINAARGLAWDANPWVVAVSFDVRHGNIDREAS